jgi:hypothetical protein
MALSGASRRKQSPSSFLALARCFGIFPSFQCRLLFALDP